MPVDNNASHILDFIFLLSLLTCEKKAQRDCALFSHLQSTSSPAPDEYAAFAGHSRSFGFGTSIAL
jgi:hypothetical protein